MNIPKHFFKTAGSRFLSFLKKETVLCIAAFLALFSMFFVPPSAAYLSYLDFRVLALLFCLMLVVAGLQKIGLFHYLGFSLLKKAKHTRGLASLLILLCFFSSMLITNDVALITFVPFAIMLLTMAGQEDLLIPVIVLQTIAANLGSMLTPIGNPQNLYLYSKFQLSMLQFISFMLPLTLVSFVLLLLFIRTIPENSFTLTLTDEAAPAEPKNSLLGFYLMLFLVCLGCVLHFLSWQIMLVILIAAVAFVDRTLFRSVDYFLLLTFVCFFVFIGNMQRIPEICDLLHRLIQGREMTLGTLLSQCISNVPAAILLSGFTDTVRPLLYGVNIGGLGTLIASLASVISFRCYGNTAHAQKGAYFKCFTLYNVLFLLILFPVAILCIVL